MVQTRVGCLAALVLSAFVALATGTLAQAQSEQPPEQDEILGSEDGWETYVNGRFGMRLAYPADIFSPAETPLEGDGRRFEAEDARIEVSAWRNEEDITPSELASRLVEGEGYRDLIRQDVEEARVVLTGYRADQVFYEEYVFEGGTVQALGIEYPVERGATYGPLVEEITVSFSPGADPGADETAEEPGEPPANAVQADPERSDQAQETGPQGPEPDGTAAEEPVEAEIVEEPPAPPAEGSAAQPPEGHATQAVEQPRTQPAKEPPAQPATAPRAHPAEELRPRPVEEPPAQPVEQFRVWPGGASGGDAGGGSVAGGGDDDAGDGGGEAGGGDGGAGNGGSGGEAGGGGSGDAGGDGGGDDGEG